MESIKPFAVVALIQDIPQHSLRQGQVGTVFESLEAGMFEVEFSNNEGRTCATLALRADQLMILHHDMAEVA